MLQFNSLFYRVLVSVSLIWCCLAISDILGLNILTSILWFVIGWIVGLLIERCEI